MGIICGWIILIRVELKIPQKYKITAIKWELLPFWKSKLCIILYCSRRSFDDLPMVRFPFTVPTNRKFSLFSNPRLCAEVKQGAWTPTRDDCDEKKSTFSAKLKLPVPEIIADDGIIVHSSLFSSTQRSLFAFRIAFLCRDALARFSAQIYK